VWLIIWHGYFMEEKYCTQLNIFHASKLSVWLNYVKSPSTKKNINHEKHVAPEDVSTSSNFNICNILLHGIKQLQRKLNEIFIFSNIFCVIILLIDYMVKFPCVQ
jgi:hypothetical protein